MAKQIRMDLIEEYYQLYRKRNLAAGRSNSRFRAQYEELSVMWMELSDEERTAVNIRFKQDNLELL